MITNKMGSSRKARRVILAKNSISLRRMTKIAILSFLDTEGSELVIYEGYNLAELLVKASGKMEL